MEKSAKEPKNISLKLKNLRQTLLKEDLVIEIVGSGKELYLWFGANNSYLAHVGNGYKFREWVKKLNKRMRAK